MADKPEGAFRVSDYPMYHMAVIRQRNHANMAHTLRAYGVSPVAWRVLAILSEQDGRNISFLAENAAVERSNMSRIVAGMVRAGLVARRSQQSDQRQRLVYLTAKGRAKYREILPVVRDRYRRNFAGLSKAEMTTLMRLLRRIEDNVFRGPAD